MDNEYGDFLDDKSITALGVLQTIGTLILTLESTPDILLHIESVLMPVIQITLENKLYGTCVFFGSVISLLTTPSRPVQRGFRDHRQLHLCRQADLPHHVEGL
jgi:hypothetical protein